MWYSMHNAIPRLARKEFDFETKARQERKNSPTRRMANKGNW